MFSIQQLIKSTRKLQASSVGSADLAKNLKHAAAVGNHYNHNQHHHHHQHQQQQTSHYEQTHLEIGSGAVAMTPAVSAPDMTSKILLSTPSPSSSSSLSLSPLKTPTSSSSLPSSLSASPSPRQRQTNVTSQPQQQQQQSHEEQLNSNEAIAIERSSNRKTTTTTMTSDNSSSGKYGSCDELSQCSDLKENSSSKQTPIKIVINTQEHKFTTTTTIASNSAVTTNQSDNNNALTAAKISRITSPHHLCNRSQKSFYQQQLQQLHTQANQSLWAKQKQTHFTMSSLAAAEPLSALKNTDDLAVAAAATAAASAAAAATTSNSTNGDNGVAENSSKSMTANKGKTCFKSGCSEILQFMELIGNLKHTKRTGWVLRDVNDCESISGHMYRMSMMTFLLDGTEGLNPIRCMELALVHDLAESIVGDLTPFCGISKEEKRNKEFKAMDDICKLIEPRGKRIMELFVEYETGESAESKFVKDLDRLDMVMQAFEYEKRDNCLLKHQEFFDSTEGKFKHPFVQQLVKEIYAQRVALAKDKGATPPPNIVVPDWEHPNAAPTANGNQSNGHCCKSAAGTEELPPEQNSSKTSTS